MISLNSEIHSKDARDYQAEVWMDIQDQVLIVAMVEAEELESDHLTLTGASSLARLTHSWRNPHLIDSNHQAIQWDNQEQLTLIDSISVEIVTWMINSFTEDIDI